MQVVGQNVLVDYMKRHADVRGPLSAWLAEAKSASWQTPQDLKDRFRSVDFLADNRVIFNIGGNRHRLVVKVRFANGIVLVEWVGTHAEYDKKKW